MIIVRPIGGLGNRLRCLNSAIKLANDTKQSLKVIWTNDPVCFCDFFDIIENILNTKVEIKNLINDGIRKSISERDINKLFMVLQSRWEISELIARFKCKYVRTNLDNIDENLLEELMNGKSLYISSCYNFYNTRDYRNIEFNSRYHKMARDIMCGNKFIGIHIRQGDNCVSIQKSPIELFEEKMESILEKNPDTMFFISTDEKKVLKRIIQKYPDNCIYFYEKCWNRWSHEGQISSLIEMLCLSMTQKIYGSYNSSFSDVAADIGKIPKEVLKV